MIFIVSAKQFEKHDKAWIKPRDYVLIDGCDSGNIQDDADRTEIMEKYARAVCSGGFTPPTRMITQMRREQENKSIETLNDYSFKTRELINDFLESEDLLVSMLSAVKAFVLEVKNGWDTQRNVFVILPQKVYKLFVAIYINRMYELMETNPDDIKFVYTQDELLAKKKLLTKDLKEKKMNRLRRQLPKTASAYDLDKDPSERHRNKKKKF